MDKLTSIKIFTNILYEFLDYLHEKYPEFSSDIYLTKTSVTMLVSNNPRLVVEQFMSYILPYSKQIVNCEEEFFLNFDNLINQDTPSNNIMFAMKIKKIWSDKQTTETDKARIWVFFKKLLKVGKRVI